MTPHCTMGIVDEDQHTDFSSTQITSGFKSPGIRRAGTIIRSPIEGRKDRDKEKHADIDMRTASEACPHCSSLIRPMNRTCAPRSLVLSLSR